MAKTGPKPKTLADRFWPKVAKGGLDECWPWLAGKNRDGYGNFTGEDRQSILAHRASWFLAHGYWPDLQVLHACDNPACVNPGHLFLGTQADNMADMFSKGRDSYGAAHPVSKLSEAQAIEIRNARGDAETIAEAFGISARQVYRVRNGESWRHLAGTG